MRAEPLGGFRIGELSRRTGVSAQLLRVGTPVPAAPSGPAGRGVPPAATFGYRRLGSR